MEHGRLPKTKQSPLGGRVRASPPRAYGDRYCPRLWMDRAAPEPGWHDLGLPPTLGASGRDGSSAFCHLLHTCHSITSAAARGGHQTECE
eukprot:9500252-Pyramimonas_sp.AAC.1